MTDVSTTQGLLGRPQQWEDVPLFTNIPCCTPNHDAHCAMTLCQHWGWRWHSFADPTLFLPAALGLQCGTLLLPSTQGCATGPPTSPWYFLQSSLTSFLSSIASCPFRLGRRLRKQSEQGNCRRPRGSIPPGSVVPLGPSNHGILICGVPNHKVPTYGVHTATPPCRPQHSSPKNCHHCTGQGCSISNHEGKRWGNLIDVSL